MGAGVAGSLITTGRTSCVLCARIARFWEKIPTFHLCARSTYHSACQLPPSLACQSGDMSNLRADGDGS